MTLARFKEYWSAVVIAIAGSPIVTYFSCTSCLSNINKFMITTSISALMWIVMWVGNSELTRFLSKQISWVEFPVKRLVVGIITTVLFTIGVALSLAKAWEYAWNIRFGGYTDFIFISLIITFLISFFLHGREFLLQWKKSAIDAERFQKESIQAQYQSLKSQVDPHFLFNSLNVLTNLVYEDADKSARFIKQLSEVYRYVLDTRSKEIVSLEEELKFLNSYLFLQQIRFENKLIVVNELQGKQGSLPPLVLQMLVENAIKHNVVSSDDPLTIKLYETNGLITVENNLQRKERIHGDSTGIGLDNIKKRYDFLTDRKVEVEEQNGKFKVTIPLLPSHE